VNGDDDWGALGTLTRKSKPAKVLALLGTPLLVFFRRALALGATAAIAQDAPLDEIAEALDAALREKTILPTPLARALCEKVEERPSAMPLSDTEIAWIRELAEGLPVTAIANQAGYSERQMYRLIARLYERMGVRTREQALVTATRWGVIPPADPDSNGL
jgi:DNA-binding NarL/FixJ family response regulator